MAYHAQQRLEHYRHAGDISNMRAAGCSITYNETFPLYIGEPDPLYLNLEYYRKPLEDEQRILIAAQATCAATCMSTHSSRLSTP